MGTAGSGCVQKYLFLL